MAGLITNKRKGLFAKKPRSGLDQPPASDRTVRVGRLLRWRHVSLPGEGSAERAPSPRRIEVRVYIPGEDGSSQLKSSLIDFCKQVVSISRGDDIAYDGDSPISLVLRARGGSNVQAAASDQVYLACGYRCTLFS